jgi:hypothetical protein
VPRYTGRVGIELTEEQGYAAAQLAALNVLCWRKCGRRWAASTGSKL